MFNKRCCQNNGQNMMMPQNMGMMDCCNREIVEPAINKCVEREFYHEVPQV